MPAAIASFWEAFALDVVKEGLLFLSVDVPKAEIIFVIGDHLGVFLLLRAEEAILNRLRFNRGSSPRRPQTDTISRNCLNDCEGQNSVFSCHF